jgi:hypothetical protein
MSFEHAKQLIILDLGEPAIEHVFGQKAEMRGQLTKTHTGGDLGDGGEFSEYLLLDGWDHRHYVSDPKHEGDLNTTWAFGPTATHADDMRLPIR